MHDVDPALDTYPLAQFKQLVAPVFAYVPAVHCVHDEAPIPDTLPGGHVEQVPPLAYVPAPHCVHDVDPALDTLPLAQFKQQQMFQQL